MFSWLLILGLEVVEVEVSHLPVLTRLQKLIGACVGVELIELSTENI